MKQLKKIKILSRKSDLAIIQANQVGLRIKEKFPNIDIEYITKKTAGDIDLKTPLSKMENVGVFTDDLRSDLVKNECDIAVHSWKDLPLDLGRETFLGGSLERADQRDILFVKKNNIEKINKSKSISVLSSSPRRIYNLNEFIKEYLPFNCKKIFFKDIRGNIPTRFEKFILGHEDCMVVAKAAIDRLIHSNMDQFNNLSKNIKEKINECLWTITPLSQNPTSPGQGALGIEVRKDNNEIIEILKKISDTMTIECVNHEREILKKYGGGCHQKIGVSFFPMFFGLMKSEKGEADNGQKFSNWGKYKNNILKKEKISIKNLYPESLKDNKLFFRKEIKESISKINALRKHCIWIARKSSIPENVKIHDSNIIWTSGIKTWKHLTRRGIWVNGTADGMGENLEANIDSLTSNPWIKLTHSNAPISKIKKTIATYDLLKQPIKKKLNTKKYFYWMSSSAFEYAIQNFPDIIQANHACGPGNTYQEIKKTITDPNKLSIALSYSSWKNDLLNDS